jgi:hypothetical protein
LTYHLSLACLRRLRVGFFYIKCRTDRLLTREYRRKLFVERVKVKTKKLFRIVLLAVLYTNQQQGGAT